MQKMKTQQEEPTAAEICFDAFRKDFPHINVYVKGQRMIFRYLSKVALESSKSLAEYLIRKNRWPLTVDTEIHKVETLPNLLIITYDEQATTGNPPDSTD